MVRPYRAGKDGDAMTLSAQWRIRSVLPDDVEYVIKTWAREAHEASPRRRDTVKHGTHPAEPGRLFFPKFQSEVILPLFKKAEARIVCPASDISVIASFAVGRLVADTFACYFAYTRAEFRRLGLARAALADMGYADGSDIACAAWSSTMSRFSSPFVVYDHLLLGKTLASEWVRMGVA